MDNDTTPTTDGRSANDRLADAAERIASALEGWTTKPKTDPLAVDKDKTHVLATEFKERTGRSDF